MKQKLFVLTKTIMVVSLFALTSCGGGDKPNPDVKPDPQGTIGLNVRNSSNGGNDFLGIGINVADNFYNISGSRQWAFASAGNVKGLGEVVNLPQSAIGYVPEIGVTPTCGYFGWHPNGDNTGVEYVAFFVEDYIKSAAGDVIGAVVKYVYPFVKSDLNEIKLSSTETALESPENSNLIMTLAEAIPYSVSVTPDDMFYVSLNPSNPLFSFVITAKTENDGNSPIAGAVTITSGSVSKTVNITQKVSQLYLNITSSVNMEIDGAASSNHQIAINSNTSWMANSDKEWCHLITSSGNNSGNIIFSVDANNSDAVRDAVITISGTGISNKTVTVRQGVFFDSGSGTQTNPYIIKTVTQLNLMRSYTSQGKYFKLANNIDLTSYLSGSIYGWEPIELGGSVFDGGGFTISGLWINRPNSENVGFFSIAAANATIKNLNLQLAPQGITGGENVGGLLGSVSFGSNFASVSISKCSVSGYKVEGKCVGGLVGWIDGYSYTLPSCTISNSYAACNVAAKGGNEYVFAGGIAGAASEYDHILYSYYAGTLTAEYTAGGTERIGGLVATAYVDIANSYFDKEKAGTGYSKPNGTTTGALTTAQMKQQASYSGWDFNTVWKIEEGISYPTLR